MMLPSNKTYVIVGLGNPGKKYELTRHNLGCLVVQELAAKHGWDFKETEFNTKLAKGKILGHKIHLLLPTTYMNESGHAVKRYLSFIKLPEENLVVVSDDVALAFGDMRFRKEGSSGGHNGLKNIEELLGTRAFARLRLGVGSDRKENQTLADYVLENFSSDELKLLGCFVQKGAAALEELISKEDLKS